MSTPWILVRRHLLAHWVRSGLTVLALIFALFLFCFVRSVVTTLDQAINSAAANRLVVQSAVSLFVNLPLSYQGKISGVPGVAAVTKFQWFGGYYQDRDNFFAQFGIDHDVFFDMYRRDLRMVRCPLGQVGERVTLPADEREALGLSLEADGLTTLTEEAVYRSVVRAVAAERRAAVIGPALTRGAFGFEMGKSVPITATIFTKPDGSAWDFTIVGVYEPVRTNVDDRTLWFRFDYLQEFLEAEKLTEDMGTGVFMVNLVEGAEPASVLAAIDGVFANGPQRTKSTTEAAFQAIFVSMLGNLPAFMGSIGGAVVFAVLFSVVNTMLMSARQRRSEVGVLKALGFGDGSLASLLVAEALVLSLWGGGLGVALALGTEEPLRRLLGPSLPGYGVEGATVALGLGVSLLVGLLSGIGPAVATSRLAPVDALRSEG